MNETRKRWLRWSLQVDKIYAMQRIFHFLFPVVFLDIFYKLHFRYITKKKPSLTIPGTITSVLPLSLVMVSVGKKQITFIPSVVFIRLTKKVNRNMHTESFLSI